MVKTGGNLTQAGVNVGYTKNYAKTNLAKVVDNGRFQAEYESNFTKALKKAEITDEFLAKTVREGLQAQKAVTFQGKVKSYEPDHFIRSRFVELTGKFRGDFAPDQLNIKVGKEQAETAFEERIRRKRELEMDKNIGESNPLEKRLNSGVVKSIEDQELGD